MKKLKDYSESEVEQITNALKDYAYSKQEQKTISAETILSWIQDFTRLQLKVDYVITLINLTKKKDTFGKTQFNNFLNPEHTYIDYEEVNKEAYKRFLQALENMNMSYQQYENKCLDITRQRQELAEKKLLELAFDKRMLQIQNYKEK